MLLLGWMQSCDFGTTINFSLIKTIWFDQNTNFKANEQNNFTQKLVIATAQHFEKKFMVHRVFRRFLTDFGVLIPNMRSVFLYRAQIFQN